MNDNEQDAILLCLVFFLGLKSIDLSLTKVIQNTWYKYPHKGGLILHKWFMFVSKILGCCCFCLLIHFQRQKVIFSGKLSNPANNDLMPPFVNLSFLAFVFCSCYMLISLNMNIFVPAERRLLYISHLVFIQFGSFSSAFYTTFTYI